MTNAIVRNFFKAPRSLLTLRMVARSRFTHVVRSICCRCSTHNAPNWPFA
jgi:hypothetical protein